MKQFTISTFLLITSLCSPIMAQDVSIFPLGEKAPNVHHTGDVWLSHLSAADSTFNYNVVVATFDAAAKLDWHMHPAGQQLLILEGTGYYQERGKDLQIVNKGDVIKCPPGVEHWHAAAPEKGVTYLSIAGNQSTVWLEKVTGEYYKGLKRD